MKSTKKDQHFHLKMTSEEYAEIKQLSENHNLSMGQYLINSGLNNSDPRYTKQVHSFILHLEALQKILEANHSTDTETDKLRIELYLEARKLWQSLSM